MNSNFNGRKIMKRRSVVVFGIAFLLLPFADCLIQEAQADASSEIAGEADVAPPLPSQEQPEVLTRGPVHEAFAEPVSLQVDEGLVAERQPPAAINEILPNEKPAGANFVWVPGYWSWDGDRNNYIWVSGCWRIAPPKMSWVPGYWTRVGLGWKWVSGFWMQTGNNEIMYLKEPPAAVDIEPSGTPPTEYSIWVPGCWYWTNDRYVLRSGYWLEGQAGWIWTPSHYVWTPRGYVFTNGHWDYTVERRGVLYAPVYFPSSVVYTRPGYRYPLGVTVDLGLLKVNLFCYPRYSHYYFGDYYDDAFIRVGIFPCFESERRHIWYDPVYQYDRWHSRDSRWDEHARHSYELRRDDRDLRPPKTYHEQESRMSKMSETQRDNFQIVRSGGSTSPSKSASRKFEQTDSDTRQKFSKQSSDVQNYREERRQWESSDTSSKGGKPSVERVNVDGSKNSKSAGAHGDSSVQSENGKGGSSRSIQKSVERDELAVQSDRIKDATPKGVQPSSKVAKPSVERVKVEDSGSVQASEGRGDSAVQYDRGNNGSSKGIQKTQDRNVSAVQSERVKDTTPKGAPSYADPGDSSGRSERVRVPDSPVSDRTSSYAGGDRYPSTPTEERRSQDGGRDLRGDDGHRGRSRDSR